MLYSIRGATTVCQDNETEIKRASVELVSKIIESNKLERVINIIISTTSDIKSFYPARAIRESSIIKDVPLFSCQEPTINGSLPLCIRVMLQVEADELEVKHIYLNEAKSLRKDLEIENV